MGLSRPKLVVSREEAVYSDRARRFFTVYVGVFYAPQVGCRGIVRAVPRGYSCRRSLPRWSSSDQMGVVNFAGESLETCVDHEVSSRNSRRRTVPNSVG